MNWISNHKKLAICVLTLVVCAYVGPWIYREATSYSWEVAQGSGTTNYMVMMKSGDPELIYMNNRNAGFITEDEIQIRFVPDHGQPAVLKHIVRWTKYRFSLPWVPWADEFDKGVGMNVLEVPIRLITELDADYYTTDCKAVFVNSHSPGR